MTPEEVYDLFWPENLHFVSPPGKPSASMRFGPTSARLWRHEFSEPHWHHSMDAEELLWERLLPMITRGRDKHGHTFPETTFPQDCIEVRRCAPYTFSQKVVNKWFHERTIIIGDAAHVFPPCGGQGITSGVRDAQALAWRLAMFETMPALKEPVMETMLSAWSRERRQAIDDSARLTKANGDLANEEETWIHALLRNCIAAIEDISILPRIPMQIGRAEQEAYSGVKDGFFYPKGRGGYKVAQACVRRHGSQPLLSDQLLRHDQSLMTLMIMVAAKRNDVERMLAKLDLPTAIISDQSIVEVGGGQLCHHSSDAFHLCSVADIVGEQIKADYRPSAFIERLGHGTQFAILRPDFIVYSSARSMTELEASLQNMKKQLEL